VFHALDCSSSHQWHYYKHRHDGIKDILLLIQFLKDYSSDDPNLYKILTEPKKIRCYVLKNQEEQEEDVTEIEEDGRMQTSLDDIIIKPFCKQYIDVAVINSAVATYIRFESIYTVFA
jgi:hypothetical protein